MKNKSEFKEERFDSFLNKTIILSSKKYFKKQMNILNKERTIVDDVDYSSFLQNFIELNKKTVSIDDTIDSLQLNTAIKSLSAIEQSVIFLLFIEELSQNDAAEILEIYSKTVSKIKIRAINKLREIMKGDIKNEE